MAWRSWNSARSWSKPDGTVRPLNRAAGTYPGSGVATGGQQGRMGMMHGGIGGARSGGTTAAASTPSTVGPTNSRPDATLPSGGVSSVGNTGTLTSGSNDHGPAIKPGASIIPQPTVTTTPVGAVGGGAAVGSTYYGADVNQLADGTNVVGGWVDPARAMAPYIDAQYWADRAGVQSEYAQQVNPLLAEINSLQHDTGSGTLHDVMLGRLREGYEFDERRRRGIASQQGNLRSGLSQLRQRDLANNFTDSQLELFNKYGGGRIQQLEAERASADAALQQQLSVLAMALAERARQRGAYIGEYSFNPNVIPGFGG